MGGWVYLDFCLFRIKVKVMKTNVLLIVFFILLICIGCPKSINEPDSEIIIINNSDQSIVFFTQFNNLGDTSLSTFPFPLLPENIEVRTIETNSLEIIPGSFRTIFEKDINAILMLYLFSRDTIKQVSWERIRDEYLVLRRYDLTLEDLEALNWTIDYP